MNGPAHLPLGGSYDVKDDTLVKGFTKYLQNILMHLSKEWSEKNKNEDFFLSHPHKKWSSEEHKKIGSRDIQNWDTPLCAKWLLEFPWKPHLRNLTEAERKSFSALRGIWHQNRHGTPHSITQEEFETHCFIVEMALTSLGADVDSVAEIITTAKNRVYTDKATILKVSDSSWNSTTNEILGSGSFGVVISVQDCIDNQNYAVKIIPNRKFETSTNGQEKILRESRILTKLGHQNVVKYKSSDFFLLSTEKVKEILLWDTHLPHIKKVAQDFFRACFDNARSHENMLDVLLIKTEICGETLREWINEMAVSVSPEIGVCNSIGSGIVDGLRYIHSNGLIHRDLRPDNIFFSKKVFVLPVKIGDFGLSRESKIYENQTMTRAVENTLYRAPEIDEEHENGMAEYNQAADLYSLGLTLSEVYDPEREGKLKNKFGEIVYARNTGPKIKKKKWLDSLILKLTEKNASLRLTNDELGIWATQFKPDTAIALEASFSNLRTEDSSESAAVAPTIVVPNHLSITLRNNYISEMEEIDSLTDPSKSYSMDNSDPTFAYQELLNHKSVLSVNKRPTSIADDLPDIRKILQKDNEFWTKGNTSKFFDILERKPVTELSFPKSPENKSAFNSKLYRLLEDRPDLVTHQNVHNALSTMGFVALADNIRKRLRC